VYLSDLLVGPHKASYGTKFLFHELSIYWLPLVADKYPSLSSKWPPLI